MLHLALTALLVAPQAAASRAADPLAEYAERIEATDSLHERVDLARFARRSDPGGSLWWYEVEARARQRIADHAAAVRLLTEALANPLVDRDRAVLHELRARSLDFLNDRERSLADLARAAELDPSRPELVQALHAELASRVDRRRVIRELREARELLTAFPEEPTVQLRWARANLDVGSPEEADPYYGALLETAPELLELSDLLAYSEFNESIGWDDVAIQSMELAIERYPGAGLEQRLVELKAGAGSGEFGGDFGYGGYGGYGGGYGGTGYMDEENLEPTEPPEAWDNAGLRDAMTNWENLIADMEPHSESYYEQFFEHEEALRSLTDELTLAQTIAEAEALRGRGEALVEQIAPWAELHASLLASATLLEDEFLPWFDWAWLQPEEHPRAAQIARLKSLGERYWALPNFDTKDLSALAGAAVDERVGVHVLRDQRERAIAELLTTRRSLAPKEVLGRAQGLLQSGPASPDLLAALGLAYLDLDDKYQALVPLHMCLASETTGAFEAEVRGALSDLELTAESLADGARAALRSGQAQQARAMAARAADLAPLRPDLHALEADCLEALDELDDALRARRLATYLQPSEGFDPLVLRSHVRLAMETRALAEAKEIADLLVAMSPRDPEALLLRVPILVMHDQAEAALADGRFARELGGRSDSNNRENWQWLIERWQPMKLPYERAWSEDDANELTGRLPWWPGGDRFSDATKAMCQAVLDTILGKRSIEDLGQPFEEWSVDDQHAWPGVAAFIAGEILQAKGDYDGAKAWYRSSIADKRTPTGVAFLASVRLKQPLRERRGSSYRPILVPRDAADLKTALGLARRGQTIQLGGGIHYLDAHLDTSVHIVGVGAERTTLMVRGPWSDNPTRDLLAAPDIPRGLGELPGVTGGWVELEDLTLETYPSELTGEERRRLVVPKGGLSLTRCGLAGMTQLELRAGASLAVLDSDLSGTSRAAILAAGGHLVLDRVVFDQPVELRAGTQLLADRLTLIGAAALELTGAGTRADIGGLVARATVGPALVLAGGATAEVERTLWRSANAVPLVRSTADTALRLGTVDQVGSAELALASAGTIELGTPLETLELASLARSLDAIVVSDSDGLKAALTNPLAPDVVVHMQPGAYLLDGVQLFGDAVLVGLGEGVQLQVRSDSSDHILRVPEGVDLVIENVELGVRTWRPAEAGSAVAKAGGAYLLDYSHEVYELLQVEGEVLLEGVSQLRQSGGDKAARELIAKVGRRGRLVSFGLSGGRGLVVEGRAQLAGGGVDILQVSGKGSIELTGRGHLERLEVTGPGTRVLLDDLRTERLDFAAFRSGANDPRSKLRRLHDGVDPEAYRDQLIAEARSRWLTDIPASPEERGEALVAYVLAHDRALAYTQPDIDKRADAAVAVVGPYLRGDVPLIQFVITRTTYSDVPYAMNQAFYRDMDPDDYRSFISANRARHALGEDATAEAVETYATWEEAVLAGEVTRDTSNIWQGMGRSLEEWRANELRVAREAAAREREATAALASGDRGRIKKALKAVGLDRWLEYVRYDEQASLYELEEALAAASGSEHQYALMRRRDELQAAQAPPASSYGSGYGSSYGSNYSGSSSGYSPGFEVWQTSMENWGRSMDRALEAVTSSSYRNYRNDYDY